MREFFQVGVGVPSTGPRTGEIIHHENRFHQYLKSFRQLLTTGMINLRQTIRLVGRKSSSFSAEAQKLLIVYHSRTGLAQQMSDAMENGALLAAKEMKSHLNLQRLRAEDTTVEDLLYSDGYLFCCPENLASVSGEMLEFFHRTYYHIFDDDETSALTGRPYGLAIAAGSDGSNAAKQIERICTGWRLRPVGDTYINRNGQPQDKTLLLKSFY